MRFPSGLAAKLLLLCISTTLALLVAEGLFRFYEKHFLLTAQIPGGDTIDLARLNYNDSTVTRKKPQDEFRALSIGDSFAYTIVRQEYGYHSVASRRAGQAAGRPVRLVNLGQPSSSFPQYHAALDTWAGRLEHDALVVNIYLGNDLLDIVYGWVPQQQQLNRMFENLDFSIATGAPRVGLVPEKFGLRLLDHLYAHWRMNTAVRPPLVDDPRYNRALNPLKRETYLEHAAFQLRNWDPDQLEKLRPGYEAARDFFHRLSSLRAGGTPVLVLLSPNHAQVDSQFRAELLAFAERDPESLAPELPNRVLAGLITRIDPEIVVLDLLEPLRCAQEQGLNLYYSTDTHWSAEGNELVGQTLAQTLLRQGFLGDRNPLESWPACVAADRPGAVAGKAAGGGVIDKYLQSLLAVPLQSHQTSE